MAKVNKSEGVDGFTAVPIPHSCGSITALTERCSGVSAETSSIKQANNKLKDLIKEVGQGSYRGGKAERIKVQEFGRRSHQGLQNQRQEIAGRRGVPLETSLERFSLPITGPTTSPHRWFPVTIEKRQTEEASNGTINRELALLKRAFSLGLQSTPPKVLRVPYIPHLQEDNVRLGFCGTQRIPEVGRRVWWGGAVDAFTVRVRLCFWVAYL